MPDDPTKTPPSGIPEVPPRQNTEPPKDEESYAPPGVKATQPTVPPTRATDTVDATRHISEIPAPPARIQRYPAPSAPREHVRPSGTIPAPGSLAVPDKRRTSEIVNRPQRKRKPQTPRRDSGLYLPLWSLLLMLLVVLAVSVGIIALVVGLGGGLTSDSTPQVMIVTSEFMPTLPSVLATETIPSPFNQNAPAEPFALAGPTLALPSATPPPLNIAVGQTVKVVNVGEFGLNIRSTPGLSSAPLGQVRQDQTFSIIGGPERLDDLTWWQIQDPFDTSVRGWVVENDGTQDTLEVVPQTQTQ
jgi:hypothetical protein